MKQTASISDLDIYAFLAVNRGPSSLHVYSALSSETYYRLSRCSYLRPVPTRRLPNASRSECIISIGLVLHPVLTKGNCDNSACCPRTSRVVPRVALFGERPSSPEPRGGRTLCDSQ